MYTKIRENVYCFVLILINEIKHFFRGDLSIGPRVFETADCMVNFEGKVACLPIAQMDAICVPDITYWPYDTQTCKLKIGSWIHRGDEIDFEASPKLIITEGYTPNSQWNLVNNTIRKDPGNYFGLNNSYPSLEYTFTIERHSAASSAMVVTPGFGKHY